MYKCIYPFIYFLQTQTGVYQGYEYLNIIFCLFCYDKKMVIMTLLRNQPKFAVMAHNKIH